jgi:hypothetical protein
MANDLGRDSRNNRNIIRFVAYDLRKGTNGPTNGYYTAIGIKMDDRDNYSHTEYELFLR